MEINGTQMADSSYELVTTFEADTKNHSFYANGKSTGMSLLDGYNATIYSAIAARDASNSS